MKTTLQALVAVSFLYAGTALAQEEGQYEDAPEATQAPTTGAPNQLPPAPPANPGYPAQAQQQQQAPQAVAPPPQQGVQAPASGQWTYTNQYGWVYLPYAQNYTYVAPDGGTAYTYAWYPTYGWRWIDSPWVLGWGPSPYWGSYGYSRFAWNVHPWFHVGIYRGGYGYHNGYGYHTYGGYHGGYRTYGGGYRGGTVYHGGAAIRAGSGHVSGGSRGGGRRR